MTESTNNPTPSSSGTRAVIFIVDDEQMVTTSLKTMLELETDHTIHVFNHPRVALDAIDDHQPDVVISDFLMPEMDGIAFLTAVKEKLSECTLILLTGYADKENAIAAINTVGIYKYIEKPWDNDSLKITIQNGLERAHLLSSLRNTISQLSEAETQLRDYNEKLEELVEERTTDLQITLEKLESIVHGTADGILTLSPDLHINAINPSAQLWLLERLKITKPIGMPIHQILSIDESHKIDALFTPEAPHFTKEARIGNLDVEASISPLPETERGFVGYVLILRDISQRKEIDRLREDFVSTLTHDLRTPLLAAIQTLELFADGSLGPMNEQQTDILRMMVQSNRDMLGLVNVLLEVYKYESGSQRLVFDSIAINELVVQICRELDALAAGKNQTLEIAMPAEFPKVHGDKQELRRVLMNLIGNAIHHTPSGGTITVEGSIDTKLATLGIRDTGRGIPKQDIGKLFQRFSQGTSKVRSSGTGLGLYLSRQIVEAHHGRIWVESEEGVGSVFYFSLPLSAVTARNTNHAIS